jgi:hypothetical protein
MNQNCCVCGKLPKMPGFQVCETCRAKFKAHVQQENPPAFLTRPERNPLLDDHGGGNAGISAEEPKAKAAAALRAS